MIHKLYMHLKKFERVVLLMDEPNERDEDIKNALDDEENESVDVVGTNLNDIPAITPDHRRDEEVASEITGFDDDSIISDDKDTQVGDQVGSVTGWVGLALSVLSFFMMPIILGGAGIIVGFIARNRGAEWLGNTAIAIGVISIIVRLFINPLF